MTRRFFLQILSPFLLQIPFWKPRDEPKIQTPTELQVIAADEDSITIAWAPPSLN